MTLHAPREEAEVAAIVREATADATALELVGGASRRGLGRPVQSAARLSLAGLDEIALYEPGELTLVAGAGTPLARIEALLEAENQQLTFEPPDYRALLDTNGTPTLGGAVASAASGPRRIRMGACRDALLGLRFVNGRGEALRSGGRVMKNVTGYDLTRLMCGAHGTLGAITQVGLKTMPRAEVATTLALSGLGDAAGVAALSAALATPTDVSGAAHLPDRAARELGFAAAVTLLRVEGFEMQARLRREALREALSGHGALEEIDGDPWPAIRDAMMFAGDARAVWRLSTRPGDAPALVAAVARETEAQAYYDWGGGLVWLAVPQGEDAGAATIRRHLAGLGGHATLIRASDAIRAAVPVFEPEAAPVARLSEAIKREFDPEGILNPGRMRA